MFHYSRPTQAEGVHDKFLVSKIFLQSEGDVTLIAKLQFQLVVPVKSNLNWDLHYNHCETTHPPTQASIFEPLLEYIKGWNLI